MRNAHVNFDSGLWVIGLMENHEVKHIRSTANYHDIGSIISNWIANGIFD